MKEKTGTFFSNVSRDLALSRHLKAEGRREGDTQTVRVAGREEGVMGAPDCLRWLCHQTSSSNLATIHETNTFLSILLIFSQVMITREGRRCYVHLFRGGNRVQGGMTREEGYPSSQPTSGKSAEALK